MAELSHFEELARRLGGVEAVKRSLSRALPPDCQPASTTVLALLHHHGEIRMSRLAELLDIDMSVTSRHVAHAVDRGWIERTPDPLDKRSRLLSLSPRGRELLRGASARSAATLAEALADWSDEDVERLNELLARLRADFGTTCRARGARHHQHAPGPGTADSPALPTTSSP
ncbi:MarR family transcriptional regulator [Streptomyces sp. WAC 00631]|uniref:MarR family winged helix-turn-helix transcriptional regulator n=1 Tax=Streptomyces sp. WAC 00631 TaxID=2203201 RepID=UPI000F7A4B43|nr:MarR family transcriptional regulator [Streptomyces sp. WAC 00631]MCC5032272.1 MarR family transcriptional regulator [Streptomyces sp. WAC 00631]